MLLLTRRSRNKKIKELDTKYQFYHSLLMGECYQIIQRIEIISHSNLIYSQYYSENLKEYRSILNKEDKNASKFIEELDEFILNSKKKGFKITYANASMSLEKFKSAVNVLNDKLLNIIKPEEDTRNQSIPIKEYCSFVRKKYAQSMNSFDICSPTFDKIFNVIDKRFEEFDKYIDEANYESAQAILPKVKKVLEELNRVIDILPNLYIEANDKISVRIDDVTSLYESLDSKRIVLTHLGPKKVIKSFKDEKSAILELISVLKVDNALSRVNELNKKINKFEELLKNEEEAKKYYDENFATVYNECDSLCKRVINIYNEIPNIEKIYIFGDPYKDIMEKFQHLEKDLSDARRGVDVNLLTTNKQPYSLIIEKIAILKEKNQNMQDQINEFHDYVSSLKHDSEVAYNLINKEYANVRKYFVIYEKYNLNKDFKDNFDHIYEILDNLVVLLKTRPIDVIAVNKYVLEYKTMSELLFNNIDQLVTYKNNCEKYILALNKIREDFNDVEINIKSAEELYNKSCYKESFIILDKIYNEHRNVL